MLRRVTPQSYVVEAEDREAGVRKRVGSPVRVVSVSSSEATKSASEASSQLNKALGHFAGNPPIQEVEKS